MFDRAIDDSRERFPEKAFTVANDGFLLKWNDEGTAVYVDDTDFENIVMKYYPGFLQIPSFANFRRLFREYGFDWVILDETNFLQFSHPFFIRGNPDLLPNVLTKRKSFGSSPRDIAVRRERRHSTPKRKHKRVSGAKYSINFDDGEYDSSNISGHKCIRLDDSSASDFGEAQPDNRGDVSEIMEEYARNEMTEEEYYMWIAQKENQGEHAWDILFPKSGHERLYTSGSIELVEERVASDGIQGNDVAIPTAHHNVPKTFVPCGNCPCCQAYISIVGVVYPDSVDQSDVEMDSPGVQVDSSGVQVDSSGVQVDSPGVQVEQQHGTDFRGGVQCNPTSVQEHSDSDQLILAGVPDYPNFVPDSPDFQYIRAPVDHAYTTSSDGMAFGLAPRPQIGAGDSTTVRQLQFAVL
jgi:hypothetical protein